MGEPRPGDFPDPIYVKTANILLKNNQVGKAGDYARYNTSGTKAWEVLTPTLITVEGIVGGNGIVQLQQDVNSTGLGDAVANAGAFGPGSWFYGIAGSTIPPNAFVALTTDGTSFRWDSTITLIATAGADSGANAVITFGAAHHIRVGDVVIVAGFTPASYNGTFVITAVTNVTITMVNAAVTAAATVVGTVSFQVEAWHAQAQFIKRSGDTFSDGATVNDICVFSMLVGGQPLV